MISPDAAPTTRISEVAGDRVEWSIVGSVAFVRSVRLADGTETLFEPTTTLREAASRMPPFLWDEVKFRFDQVTGPAAGTRDPNGRAHDAK